MSEKHVEVYKLSEIQQIIHERFKKLKLEKPPFNLYKPIDYLLSNGGKRIRPCLVLMGYNLFDNQVEKALSAAVAIEIFHNFTLMHDDIMDKANLRRGKTTVHKKWNENTAVLSGDAMAIIAYHYLAKYNGAVLQPLIELFNKTALEVCEGQQYDMEFETRKNVTEQEYLTMIELKTSVLIAAALKIGAIIANAPKEDADHLYEFGKNIGIAFQLQDDYLDTFGDEKSFGKKIGGDIVANKKTYLLINALKIAEKEDKIKLFNLLVNCELNDTIKINKVIDIYKKYQIDKTSSEKMKEYYELALSHLQKVSLPKESKTELQLLANKLLDRNN